MKLGLEPNKSLSMKFPKVPKKYQRHFIRGLWDGDGSIRIVNKTIKKNYWRCDYVCGSIFFINKLRKVISNVGISNTRIYKPPNANAYYLIISNEEIPFFHDYLYKKVDANSYYSKKYEAFLEAKENYIKN